MTYIGGYPTQPFRDDYLAAVPSPEPPLEVERIFVQTDAWGAGEWRNVAPMVAAKRVPIVSTKLTGSWAQAATGSNDARLDTAVDGLIAIPGVKTLPFTPYLSFHHEPEGDGTPADYNAMWRRYSTRYLAKLKAGGWDLCFIPMGGTFMGWTQWTAAQWDQAIAGTGVTNVFADVYEKTTGSTFRPPTATNSVFNKYFTTAKAKGWKIALPEMGVHDHLDQAGFINALAAWPTFFEAQFVCYYNRDAGQGGATGNSGISDNPDALRAFSKLYKATTVPVPEPDCSEVEAELAATKAELATAEADLEAAKAETAAVAAQRDEALERLATIHTISA